MRLATAREMTPEPDVHIVLITPVMAEEWLALNKRNRKVHEKLVNQYSRDMLAGKWQFVGDPIRRSSDGTVLDGQHRLHAIARSGVTIKCLVIVGLPADSQIVMDSGRKRTFGDNLKIQGESQYSLVASTTKALVQWRHGEVLHNNYQPSVSELNEQFAQDSDAIRFACDFGRHLTTVVPIVPTMASLAYYLCQEVDPVGAKEFFTRFADGADLSAGNPVHTLRERLVRSRINDDRLSPGEQLYLVIRAWNAWQAGEVLSRLPLPKSGLSNATFPRPAVPRADGSVHRDLTNGNFPAPQ